MNTISSAAGLARDLQARGVAYASEIAEAAQRYRLDPRLLAAVAAQETGGPGSNAGRNVVGDGGHGHGLFQIDDRSHAFARSEAAMDPRANADYAGHMLSDLMRRFGGDVHKALSAYNAGDPSARGTVTQWQDGERLGYADSVLRHYDALRAESATEQANVSELWSFAQLQLPAMPQQQGQTHTYRQLTGLDDNGHARKTEDFASILDPDLDS